MLCLYRIGSSVSGLTTGIIIPGVPLLDDPYVMPCLIGGSVNALGLIATIIFVPETLKKSDQPTKKKVGTVLFNIFLHYKERIYAEKRFSRSSTRFIATEVNYCVLLNVVC